MYQFLKTTLFNSDNLNNIYSKNENFTNKVKKNNVTKEEEIKCNSIHITIEEIDTIINEYDISLLLNNYDLDLNNKIKNFDNNDTIDYNRNLKNFFTDIVNNYILD